MHAAANGQHKYYLTDKLKGQLKLISDYPLTIVAAPSGFGKTTAIREYLRAEKQQADCEWYTCLGESASGAWSEICCLFSKMDGKAANDLKSVKTPALDTLRYIKAYLKKLKCRRETYLVIDNYQRMQCDLHWELIETFSMHENPNLHIIIVTHQLAALRHIPFYHDSIYAIDALSFFFDREDIAMLFRLEGIRISDAELDDMFARTEGWISAIRLQMLHYKETGSFVGSSGIEQLVKTAIWNRLQPQEKDLLLAVSVFDSFTARQAADMLDHAALPGAIDEWLKASDFIRFLPDKCIFTIHNILLNYLRNQFHYHQPKEYQTRLLHKAGMSCAALGQYCSAASFFYRIGDFDALLSLPFTFQYMESQKEKATEDLFLASVEACPDEILCRHPDTMIVFAHFSLMDGKYAVYERLRGLLRTLTQEEPGRLSGEERRKLSGELILLETWGDFNDLAKMKAHYETAHALWGESPDILKTPWVSVFPTTVGLFWRESGTLDELLISVDSLQPVFRAFSRGPASSLMHLIQGEAMLIKGEEDAAEILFHRALYEARSNRQPSACIYAELCLAYVFILRGEVDNFLAIFKRMQEHAASVEDLATRRMADLCLSTVSLLLGSKEYVAPWLCDRESIRKSMYVPVVPFGDILYFRLLLLDKRYNELFALIPLALEVLEHPYANIKYRMPQLHYLIFLAVARYNTGNKAEAQRCLGEALAIALPDGVYLPFAEYPCIVSLLAELQGGTFPAPLSGGKAAPLLALCKRRAKGVSTIQKALSLHKSPLTPREREVALLAKERLSAKEIAAELYISERTVDATLGSVYRKLGIHSKSGLIGAEF